MSDSQAVKIKLRIERPDGTWHEAETVAPDGVGQDIDEIIARWSSGYQMTYKEFQKFEQSRRQHENR